MPASAKNKKLVGWPTSRKALSQKRSRKAKKKKIFVF
jgi:hypothetical protein